jgi:LmbE family N-acetylglucosaminyl deacetylase
MKIRTTSYGRRRFLSTGELNIDHQRTFEAVMTATEPMKNEVVKTIITFETPSSTEWQASNDPRQFNPNLFVEVSEENIQAKCDGMKTYKFERRNWPHPRYSKTLKLMASAEGSVIGRDYAEEFQIMKTLFGR